MPVFPNTALLDLGHVSPKFSFPEIRRFLDSIGVVASDLRGLWNRPDVSRQQLHLTFNSAQRHGDFCRQYGGKSRSVAIKGIIDEKEVLRNAKIAVIDISKNWKDVRIGGLPMMGFDLSILVLRLKAYGEVKEAEWETYFVADKDDPYKEVFTGFVKVKVVVEKIIPNFIYVGGYQVTVKYRGQPKTCALCDSIEHLAIDCPKNRKNRNTFAGNNGTGQGKPQTRDPSNPWGLNPPKPPDAVQSADVSAHPTPETGETPVPAETLTEAVQTTATEPVISANVSTPSGIETNAPEVGGLEPPTSLNSETTESRSDVSVPLPDDDFEMEETESQIIPAGQVPKCSGATHVSETQSSMELEEPPTLSPLSKETEESGPASKFLKGAEGSKQNTSANPGAKASGSESEKKFLSGAHHKMTATELSAARFKFNVHNKRK